MVQTVEAQAFLARIAALPKGPGISLDEVLQPSLDDETELRRLLATDRSNARLSNPFVGLVDVFDAPSDIRTTRARIVKDEQESEAKYVMPLTDDKRRKEGEPCMVADLEEFKQNWSIFTEGSLAQLTDWNNVIAAGGSVLACLTPLSEADKVSKRTIRKHYHSAAYPTSDVDLFLWGLTPEQAEKKIISLYEAVRDSVPWDVTCVRTKNTISIHSQYPYRSVQIVLRLYHSPAEILAGFDIDAPCCAYDGTRVWTNPRAIVAMMRQCNTTDVTRRSPSYEVRLSKYARRGFEVYVPSLVRQDIDPTIYERSIARVEGLARLLVLERLATADKRQEFLRVRRELRGRPAGPWRYKKSKRQYKNDLKLINDLEELEMNNYDVASLHIPYGPGWSARRIDKLIYQTDLGMNSTFNPKNKGRRLHRHPAFFGTIEECMDDCCESCPEPIDEAERELQKEEDELYIRGRVSFIQENPGRQIITGSFNPIDIGEWSAQVYIGQTERFFTAIAAHDRPSVTNMIKEGMDVNRRDHLGRSPLHFSIMCKAIEIACDLVDAGARMTARLVDGRTSLHLAIQHNQVAVVRKLLEKSAQNKETVGVGAQEKPDEGDSDSEGVRPSSEDDWSSEDCGVMEIDDDDTQADDEDGMDENEDNEDGDDDKPKKVQREKKEEETPNGDEIPDDNTSEPDVFDLSAADWDFGLTPLGYAVIFAAYTILEDLIAAGVDVKASTQSCAIDVHPLTLTTLRPDEDEACKFAERLILAGAASSSADSQFQTIFYHIVVLKKVKLALTIMRCDPNASAVINFPSIRWSHVTFPIVHAIHDREYSMVAALLAYGAKLDFTEDDITKAVATRPKKESRYVLGYGDSSPLAQTFMPVETAIGLHDDIVELLISMGAIYNTGIQSSKHMYASDDCKLSILDWVNMAIEAMEKQIKDGKEKDTSGEKDAEDVDFSKLTNWEEYATLYVKRASVVRQYYKATEEEKMADIERMESTKQYLEDVRKLLVSIGAKTWAELNVKPTPNRSTLRAIPNQPKEKFFKDFDFVTLSRYYYRDKILQVPRYHELFQACLDGDNDKIQALCLPPQGDENDVTPLQITVQLRDPAGNIHTGITPFSLAVEKRNWDTARLILAIASAQYDPEEPENDFSVDDMELDDDESDKGSDYSAESDETVDQKKTYVDVAKRPSTLKCDVKPGIFFTIIQTCHPGSVFHKAIKGDDLEAFVKMLNMVANLTIPENTIGDGLVQPVLSQDRSEMLDELIRRMGVGIDLKIMRHEAKDAIPTNDENRLYLGLKVHGKKRADLARKNDPNAGQESHEFPLLWRALIVNGEKVLDYLSSERPYFAYRSYAMSHNGERAERLRSIDRLKELLPQWLGFRINSLGESPLTAAVLSGEVGVVKILFAKHKNLMKAMLHEKYKPADLNILQIALRRQEVADTSVLDTQLLDFLLAKNISPLETDSNGANIYHFLCQRNRCQLLRHLLEKLPSDVNEALFKQQTRQHMKTPLHFAVENGAIKAVEMLLACSNAANTIRDSDGCLPLHIAIRKCVPRIAKLLIDASPSTLLMEDGVGSIPLETISLNRFQASMKTISDVSSCQQVKAFECNGANKDPERLNLAHLEKELPRLRETVDLLLKEGRLRKNTKLEGELLAFADRMEEHTRRLQQVPVVVTKKEEPKKVENPIEYADGNAAYDVVKEASNQITGKRELIHLIDVQKSMDRNLKRSYDNRTRRTAEEDGLQAEEKETEKSIVQQYAYIDLKGY